MDDKLIRQIAIIVLVIIGIIGALTLLQTVLQMIVPIAIIAIGGFAFYKIAIEGRDEADAMSDEVAESSGMMVESTAEAVEAPAKQDNQQTTETVTPEAAEKLAQERLSAVEKAQRDYVDNVTPAEEILDQIKARKQRLQGDDE